MTSGKRKNETLNSEEIDGTSERSQKRQRVAEEYRGIGSNLLSYLFQSKRHNQVEDDYYNTVINEIAENVIDFEFGNKYMDKKDRELLTRFIIDFTVILFVVHPIKKSATSITKKQEYLEETRVLKKTIRKYIRFLVSSIHYNYITEIFDKQKTETDNVVEDYYQKTYLDNLVPGFCDESQNIKHVFNSLISGEIPDNIEEIVKNEKLPEPKILSIIGGRHYIQKKLYMVNFSFFSSIVTIKSVMESKIRNLKSLPINTQSEIESESTFSDYSEYVEKFVDLFPQISPLFDKYISDISEKDYLITIKNLFTKNQSRYAILDKFSVIFNDYMWSLHRSNQTKERIKLVIKSDRDTNVHKLSKILDTQTTELLFKNTRSQNLSNKFVILDKKIVIKSVPVFDKNNNVVFIDITIGEPKTTKHCIPYCFLSNVRVIDQTTNFQELYESQTDLENMYNKTYTTQDTVNSSNSMQIDNENKNMVESFDFFEKFDTFFDLIKKHGDAMKTNNITFTMPFIYTIRDSIFDQRLMNKNENRIRIDFTFNQIYKKTRENTKTGNKNIDVLLDKNFNIVITFSKLQFLGVLKKEICERMSKDSPTRYDNEKLSDTEVLYKLFVNGEKKCTTVRYLDNDTTLANIGFKTMIKFVYDDEIIVEDDTLFSCYVVVRKDSGIDISKLNNLPDQIKLCSSNNIFNKIYGDSNYDNVNQNNPLYQTDFKDVMAKILKFFAKYEIFDEKKRPYVQGDLSFIGLLSVSLDTYLVDQLVYMSLLENIKMANIQQEDNLDILDQPLANFMSTGRIVNQSIFHSGSYVDIRDTDILEYNRTVLFINLIKENMLTSEEYCKNRIFKCGIMLHILMKYLKNWFMIRSVYPSNRLILRDINNDRPINKMSQENTESENEKLTNMLSKVKKSAEELSKNTEHFLRLIKFQENSDTDIYETFLKKDIVNLSNSIKDMSSFAEFSRNSEIFIKDYISKDPRFKSSDKSLILEAKKDFIEIKNFFREVLISEINKLKLSKDTPPGTTYLLSENMFSM